MRPSGLIGVERSKDGGWTAVVPAEPPSYTTVHCTRRRVPLPISPRATKADAELFARAYLERHRPEIL